MFNAVLVANRGEIARRVLRTAKRLGVRSVAVYSSADETAAHVQDADSAVAIGDAPASASYLNGKAIIAAAVSSGADAIHPGYGFLSESPVFAEAVVAAGLLWIGPSPEVLRAVGSKITARRLMAQAGVPVNAGGEVMELEEAVTLADRIGFPIMVKAAAGGGGIGMQIVHDRATLVEVCRRTRDQAQRFFGDGALLVERFFERARHVEVQILGLADGRVIALGDRDCSVQRRFQKVVEETPSPGVSPELRARMLTAAIQGAEAVGYRGAGTVEYLVSGDEFIFLEVNARLQVEHPITELVTGVDLVEAQFRIACGEPPGFDVEAIQVHGHALELRVYAEDPRRFLPGPGKIAVWREPRGPGVRMESGYRCGDVVTSHYDPLMAKLCVFGETRVEALDRARDALAHFTIEGPKSNLPFLAEVLENSEFCTGDYDTGLVGRMRAA